MSMDRTPARNATTKLIAVFADKDNVEKRDFSKDQTVGEAKHFAKHILKEKLGAKGERLDKDVLMSVQSSTFMAQPPAALKDDEVINTLCPNDDSYLLAVVKPVPPISGSRGLNSSLDEGTLEKLKSRNVHHRAQQSRTGFA